jgi:hypothetical protein
MLIQHDTYRHLLDAAAFLGMSGDPDIELDLSIRAQDVVQCALNADPAWQQARLDLAKADAFLESERVPEFDIEAWDSNRWNDTRLLFLMVLMATFLLFGLLSLLPIDIPFLFLISLFIAAVAVNLLRERSGRHPYNLMDLIRHAATRIQRYRQIQLHRNQFRHWSRIRLEAMSTIQMLSLHYASFTDQLTAEIRLAWKKGVAVNTVLFEQN